MKAAILGCGPAGLLAAHACQINQVDFTIFSRPEPSRLFGSQYLHEPITGITGEAVNLEYWIEGTIEMYRSKVYGKSWDGTVSPEDYEGDHAAWDIRDAYRRLWERYSKFIVNVEIARGFDDWIENEDFDAILSTVPRTLWRSEDDSFKQAQIWAVGDAPELLQFAPFSLPNHEDNKVICDGTDAVGWHRLSKIFGHTTIEWPDGRRPPVEGVTRVIKPLSCRVARANGEKWHHLGRYGKWEKGVLTTDAFNDALRITG